MLKGRLGLETARIPHVDRHGLLWLSRGRLSTSDGTLIFITAGDVDLPAGEYTVPFQMLSCLILGPGSTVTHDALRLLARHGTGVLFTGQGGTRMYASMPFGPNNSALARKQAHIWADAEGQRMEVARRMYAWRLGELFTQQDISVLRGIEGARMKETYAQLATRFDIPWHGRRYNRLRPETADIPNQAINHAATAIEAAAMVAVASTGTLPQLGFIHEDSGVSFCLDIADLYRDSVTLPIAFATARKLLDTPLRNIEREVRGLAAVTFKKEQLIPNMIDRIKGLLDADDNSGYT